MSLEIAKPTLWGKVIPSWEPAHYIPHCMGRTSNSWPAFSGLAKAHMFERLLASYQGLRSVGTRLWVTQTETEMKAKAREMRRDSGGGRP